MSELKVAHPFHYWVRLLLFAFIVFTCMIYLAENSEGAYTASTFNTSSNAMFYDHEGTHTKDGKIVAPYENNDADLCIAYKTPGEDWCHAEIASVDWNGGSQSYIIASTKVTSNNTVLLFTRIKNGGVYPACLWIKWPSSDWDDWDYRVVNSQNSIPFDMEVNNTDRVAMLYREGSTYLKGRIYDIENDTFIDTTQFVSVTNAYGRLAANNTGIFWVAYMTVGGYYMTDWDETITDILISTNCGWPDIACLDNDRFIVTGEGGSGINLYLNYWFQSSHEGGFTLRQDLLHDDIYRPRFSLKCDSLTVTIIVYSQDESKLYECQEFWNASQAAWQSSVTEIGDTGHALYAKGGFNSLWPQYNGISFERPKAGAAMVIDNYPGGTNAHQLWTDEDIDWWGDLSGDPVEITTTSLDSGIQPDWYEFTMTASDGVTPYSWEMVSGPAWLAIGEDNGTLYGNLIAVGSHSVTIRVTDDVLDTDEETFSLVVTGAGSGDDEEDESIPDWLVDEMGDLWLVLAITALVVGLARSYIIILHRRAYEMKRYRREGRAAQRRYQQRLTKVRRGQFQFRR